MPDRSCNALKSRDAWVELLNRFQSGAGRFLEVELCSKGFAGPRRGGHSMVGRTRSMAARWRGGVSDRKEQRVEAQTVTSEVVDVGCLRC